MSVPSAMVPLGTPAPDFKLSDPDGNVFSLGDFSDADALLVMFICNHCPYVKHIQQKLSDLTKEYMARSISVVAINSNDVNEYPEDAPEYMAQQAKEFDFQFPYLIDETQEVGRAYKAACTPDFFLYDHNHKLVYRGQFDDSRPKNNEPVTGADLRAALEAVLTGGEVSDQKPSMGCSIKWKPGNEPDYAQ